MEHNNVSCLRRCDYIPIVSTVSNGIQLPIYLLGTAVGALGVACTAPVEGGLRLIGANNAANSVGESRQGAQTLTKLSAGHTCRSTVGLVPILGNGALYIWDGNCDTLSSSTSEAYIPSSSSAASIQTGRTPHSTPSQSVTLSQPVPSIPKIDLNTGTVDYSSMKDRVFQFQNLADTPLPKETFILIGAQLNPIHSPNLNNWKQLNSLTLKNCELKCLPLLPDNVREVSLISSRFLSSHRTQKKKTGLLIDWKSVQLLNIDACQGRFILKLAHSLHTLSVKNAFGANNQELPTDDWFDTFPDSLRSLTLIHTDVSAKLIESLPSDLTQLTMANCRKITLTEARIRALFPHCKIQGFHSPDETLRDRFMQQVVGQPRAIDSVMKALSAAKGNLGMGTRPRAVLFFVGPSGVGKTELASALAQIDQRTLLRFDMAEYQAEHEAAKLIGAPPGYVGHGQGGRLTEAVRQHPNAVILLDEIEKANSTIHKVLLGVFDAGRLTDSSGKTTDFSQTIVIMTSNLGARKYTEMDWSSEKVLEQASLEGRNLLSKTVSPEFAGRIHEIVPFQPLIQENIVDIARARINHWCLLAKKQHQFELLVEEAVILDSLNRLGITLGARPVVNDVLQTLNAWLGQAVGDQVMQQGETGTLTMRDGALAFILDRKQKGKIK